MIVCSFMSFAFVETLFVLAQLPQRTKEGRNVGLEVKVFCYPEWKEKWGRLCLMLVDRGVMEFAK